MKTEHGSQQPSGYWNPYLAGLLLGVTLLASFLVLGAGLGASSGIARIGAYCEAVLAPVHTAASEYFGRWGENPLAYYLVFMFVGVFLGVFGLERSRVLPQTPELVHRASQALLRGWSI